jgi:hypothetical protein
MFMKPLVIALPLLFAGLCSCDKAKQAVDAARVKMGGVTDPGAPADPGGEVAPNLASQVDSAAEGVRFRRDLPFPVSLGVRVIERQTFKNVRIFRESELGREALSYTGTWETVGSIESSGNRVALSLEKSGEVLEIQKGEEQVAAPAPADGNKPVVAPPSVAGARVEFELGPDGWRKPAGKGLVEFGNLLIEQSLLPVLPDMLVGDGILARTQWFSSTRRWIGGDKFVLEGESLALLFPGKSTGKVTLTYEAAEALEGHPCGRFAVEGDVALKSMVSMSGESSDSEITINSGKVWCSLIYPLILREEYQTVQTMNRGSGKGPKMRVQGAIDTVIARQWKP